jgi:hypothetical protein
VLGDVAPQDKAPTVVVLHTDTVDMDTVLGSVAGLHAPDAEQHCLLGLQALP